MKYTSPYSIDMIPVRTVMETEYYRIKDMRKKRKDRQKEEHEIEKF